jgi:hypothetical protein
VTWHARPSDPGARSYPVAVAPGERPPVRLALLSHPKRQQHPKPLSRQSPPSSFPPTLRLPTIARSSARRAWSPHRPTRQARMTPPSPRRTDRASHPSAQMPAPPR